jgi:4,5:9,10-diseco-3-hydroxy-5,9,17-trioxoandrosta-1(10),2-diene-4-oate hydrolase
LRELADCGEWKVHYTVFGQGGYPLILLHGGAPASSGEESFSKNIASLAEQFQVYAIDFPSWGRSSPRLIPEGLAANPIEVGADVVAAFMRTVGIDKAHLLGGSFGGAVALVVALKYPHLVDRLVLAAPAGGDTKGVVSPGLFKLLTYYEGEGPTHKKYRDLMQHMVYDKSLITEDVLERRYPITCTPEARKFFPLRRPGGTAPVPLAPLSAHPALAGVESPVLFIWGKEDEVQPVLALSSFGLLRNQQAVIFGECGHWSHLEYPERFNAAVQEFLSLA